MPIHRWLLTVACGAWGVCLACSAAGAAPDSAPLGLPGAPGATPQQPAPPAAPLDAAHQLVRQLGHDDFRVREAATKRLKDMGKTAMPALREALSSPDPEVCSRADALVRQIERPRVPNGWFTGRNVVRRVQTMANGNRIVEVDETGRKVRITEGPGGIEMTLSGVDNGEVVSATFRARDLAELRRQDPDAYALYERLVGSIASGMIRGRRPQIVPMPQARGRLLPLAPAERPLVVRPPADDLLQLEVRLRMDMRRAGVADVEQQAVLDALRLLRDIQTDGQFGLPQDLDAQVRKYNALSDALRKKLDDLDLPGPGDALPPPAHARLGISVVPPELGVDAAEQSGVTVRAVLPNTRGEKLGLREGDVIRKVSGKPVNDAASLRRVLTDEKDPLVLDIVRDGKEQTLREKK
jgi:hypothetical protein